ncbi:hypothetical protein OH77DRAFT_1417392 [Trametes cingulata]|nr:hypothetical protein OH77DRAFT_1417392 [Trametes cingulata]
MAKYTTPPSPATSSSDFKNPDHFIPIKGRAGRVYCKICTPPDRPIGQAMTVAAAQRHERENSKHQDKIAEEALWNWSYQHQPDWTTPEVPQGASAWELDPLSSERLNAHVNFWLDGIVAAARGERPPRMATFTKKYDKLYQEAKWGLKFEDWDDEEEEWPLEEWDGVEGHWYQGGSFFPEVESYEWTPCPTPISPSEIHRRCALWADTPDPGQVWDVVDDSQTPWGAAPAATWEEPSLPVPVDPPVVQDSEGTQQDAEKMQQDSEMTSQQKPELPPSPPSTPPPPQQQQLAEKVASQGSEKTASQGSKRRRRHRRGGRGRGRGQGQQAAKEKEAHVPDSATRRVEAQRNRWAMMY